MPSEDIDDAALAIDGERDLGRSNPPILSAKLTGDGLVHRRVTGIHGAIGIPTG